MSELGFVLSHYLAISLAAFVSYIFGRFLLWRVRFNSRLEQFAFSLTLGLGVLAYLVLFLGLLGWLYRSVLLSIILIGCVCSYRVYVGWPRKLYSVIKTFKKRQLVAVLAIGTVLALAAPVWLLPLYPPTAFDGTMYHLPAAKLYALSHRIIFAPYLRYPVFPQTNEMLFTLAILVYDDILAHLFQFLLMIALTTGLVAFGQRYFSLKTGWWAAAILLANPMVMWCSSVAYIEMGLMLFVTMAVYGFFNWYRTREQQWLIIAAVFCGLATGIKYNALFFPLVLQIVALYVGFSERRYLRPIIFGCVVLLVACPWFARNFYYMRNPVFPYFYKTFASVFGVGRLDPTSYAAMTTELSAYGVGKSIKSLIMLPWHLGFNQQPFVVEAPLSPLYFYLLPILLVGAVAVARIRALLVLVSAYTLFWFFSAQILRYLLPTLPLLSLACGASLDYLFNWIPVRSEWKKHKAIAAFGFAILILPGWMYAVRQIQNKGPLPVTQQQREAYFIKQLPSYSAYNLLNKLKGNNYTLYSFHDSNMNYFADGRFIGDWFGPGKYELIDMHIGSGQALYGQLKSMGVDCFLRHAALAQWVPELPKDEFFKTHFSKIYSQADIDLYEITDKPLLRRVVGLLQNPGFEELSDGHPIEWQISGNLQVDITGKNSASGAVAVKSNGAGDVIYQFVAVKPGESYRATSQARGDKNDQTGKLQINWLDAQGRLLKEEIELIRADTKWKQFVRICVAPTEASTAVIYLDSLDRDSIWFDDISFGHIRAQP